MKDTIKKIQDIIYKVGEIKEKINIEEDTSLVNDLGFDSIKLILLIVELENTFDIELDDDAIELEKLDSTNKIIKIIEEKIGK